MYESYGSMQTTDITDTTDAPHPRDALVRSSSQSVDQVSLAGLRDQSIIG